MRWVWIALLLTACSAAVITASVVHEYTDPTEVYFCPSGPCRAAFVNALNNAQHIDCALYDIDIPEAIHILQDKNARLVLDDQSSNRSAFHAVIDSKYSQMHNKFCILDNKIVTTGSMNPTLRDISVNDNNLLIFHSKHLAELYEQEFEELYSGTFSGGAKTKNNVFYINNEKITVSFCPEDWCANKILDAMDAAHESIYFMDFSFTHDQIADMLIKKKQQGLIVKGIMEKNQNSKFSVFKKLNQSGIEVKWDKNKGFMHHKVFILDRSIVITGSMNPTLNGDTNNDENSLIIESPDLAAKYLDEFSSIYP